VPRNRATRFNNKIDRDKEFVVFVVFIVTFGGEYNEDDGSRCFRGSSSGELGCILVVRDTNMTYW
jgi:hypothetical protein